MTERDRLKELRQRLNLTPEDTLERLPPVRLAEADTHLGYAAGDVWADVEAARIASPKPLGIGVDFAEWTRQAGVFRLKLAGEDSLEVIEGNVKQLGEQEWWVDARGAPALLRLELMASGEFGLDFDSGACDPFRVGRHVPAPKLAELSGRSRTQPWFLAQFSEWAESPAQLDRIAAAGLVLRLWEPEELGEVQALAKQLASGPSPIAENVRAFCQPLSAVTRAALLREAVFASDTLVEDLAELDEPLDRPDDETEAITEQLAVDRERLECISEALALVAPADALRHALRRVDDEARPHLSLLACAPTRHPLLRSVSWQRPECWWGLGTAAQRERED